MIINSLLIENFGIYYGSYLFDFRTCGDKKNIILIGGENGTGKTTLLNAIKFSLYGSLMLGIKYPANNHVNILEQKFYNNKAYEKKEPCVVELDISLVQNGDRNQYKIQRGMTYIKGDIRLTTGIFKNDVPLNKKEVSDFEDYIRRFMPPSIFEFFFFDGEKIYEIFNNGNYAQHINESAKSLFNIDIFDSLQSDINLYMAKESISSALTDEQQRYTDLISKRSSIEKAIESKKIQINQLVDIALDLKKNIRELEEDFRINGGLIEKERAELNSKMNQLEHDRKILNQEIREYVTETLPLSIPRTTFSLLAEQLKHEIDMHSYEAIKEKLSPDVFKEILQQYMFKNNKTFDALDSLPEFLYSYINNSLDPNINELKAIHNLSKTEAEQIITFFNKTITYDHTLPQIKYAQIEKINRKLSGLRQQLKNNMENDRFGDLIRLIDENNSKIIESEAEHISKKNELNNLNLLLKNIEDEIKEVKDKITNSVKSENVFSIAQKINHVIEDYKKIILNKKYVQIEEYFFEMFSKLIRKDSFIRTVSFDADTYNIVLHDKEGYVLDKDSLSAGENEIYILSFIWAIINTSKREFPLVFDTLLGRLDLAHKHNIIHNLLPNAGKQVILLSTNTEITIDLYKELNPYIAKQYMMTYDSKSQLVTVDNKFFFEMGE